jgi:hypothetical protein
MAYTKTRAQTEFDRYLPPPQKSAPEENVISSGHVRQNKNPLHIVPKDKTTTSKLYKSTGQKI